ncbi:MAG TPA: Uma2 family endonuclease [Allocoleopsis sp.]
MMILTENRLEITWEKLPDTYILPDDPVDNIIQPTLAFALEEILEIAGLLTPAMLVATNFGICATVNKKTVVKAPDWVFIPRVKTTGHDRRSYTPHEDGDPPAIVMEFLSHTPGGEYSLDSSYPYGKIYFYQNILQVPIYVIFNPDNGRLEVR